MPPRPVLQWRHYVFCFIKFVNFYFIKIRKFKKLLVTIIFKTATYHMTESDSGIRCEFVDKRMIVS